MSFEEINLARLNSLDYTFEDAMLYDVAKGRWTWAQFALNLGYV